MAEEVEKARREPEAVDHTQRRKPEHEEAKRRSNEVIYLPDLSDE